VLIRIGKIEKHPTVRGDIDLNFLPDGSHHIEVFSQEGVPLQSFKINKKGTKFDPAFVDLQSYLLKFQFSNKDAPIQNAPVAGTISSRSNKYNFSRTTDPFGTISVIVPESTIEMRVTTADKKTLEHRVTVPKLDPVTSQKESRLRTPTIGVNTEASFLHLQAKDSLALLADISGSMEGEQIEREKRTLIKILEESISKSRRVAIMTWNTNSYWCLGKQWLGPELLSSARNWIQSLRAEGGTAMEQAILMAIKSLPDVKEICVLCDGDITPFDVNSWRTFRAAYPAITFSFIAIGESAQWKEMQQMALIGGGSFNRVIS
jgi:hypothetical protein